MMELAQMTKLEGGRYQDENGLILPWYTSPCLEWLITLDFRHKKVFEYGVGDSTAWYHSKGAYVRGVESVQTWASFASAIHETERSIYVKMPQLCGGRFPDIDNFKDRWDIIIVDGDYRDECAQYALPTLKPGGYLILDNYKQETVWPDWPLTEELIKGMPLMLFVEVGHWDSWTTAVIQKP